MFNWNPKVFLIIILLILLSLLHITSAKKKYPCAYSDTINITDGLRLKDGSYSFEGLVIPANLTAEYKIKVIDGVEYGAERHMRGCICLLKPCISFCCPFGMIFNELFQNCTERDGIGGSGLQPKNQVGVAIPNNPFKFAHIEVSNLNGSVQVVSISDRFLVRYDFGCKYKFLDLNEPSFWKWDLYMNGTLSRDGKTWSTDEYCFTPLQHKRTWSLTPLTCVRHQKGIEAWIYAICIAIGLIIYTFIALFLMSVHRFRRSSHGEVIIFHLLSFVIGYALLVYLALKNPMNLSETACRSLGFLAYFFIILSFLFLNLISWEFWCKFDEITWIGWKRKVMYLFVILLAFALKSIVKYAQDSNIEQYFKPGIGDSVCWFDVRLMGILFYYYIPILISLLVTIFLCTKAYIASWNLPTDESVVLTVDFKLIKSQFYAFLIYLIFLTGVIVREIVVWILSRLREYYFMFDFWTGICLLALSVIGFYCFLWKNKLVESWWQTNVLNKPDDFSRDQQAINPRNKTEGNINAQRSDETEQISLAGLFK